MPLRELLIPLILADTAAGFIFYYPTLLFTRNLMCPVQKLGHKLGEATMFQEEWVHGKTGACGFEKPLSTQAEGYFAAVGSSDWETGYACGTCALLKYRGRSVVVNIVDRCWGCTKGWFDLGGPAWRELTGGKAPGHIFGVESSWVECPSSLTGGRNLQVYVKPGSQQWDARFQPVGNIAPVKSMSIRTATGVWQRMKKCENFMFCKPPGSPITATTWLRVSSQNMDIDLQMSGIPEGQYLDTGLNNGRLQCSLDSLPASEQQPGNVTTSSSEPASTSTEATLSASLAVSSDGKCSPDGLFPDPDDCRGFVKCAQGDPYHMQCSGGLYFDLVTQNCNWPTATSCGSRPVRP